MGSKKTGLIAGGIVFLFWVTWQLEARFMPCKLHYPDTDLGCGLDRKLLEGSRNVSPFLYRFYLEKQLALQQAAEDGGQATANTMPDQSYVMSAAGESRQFVAPGACGTMPAPPGARQDAGAPIMSSSGRIRVLAPR